MPVHFSGEIPASKSILNRLLILQSFAPQLKIIGDSQADDVVKMKSALLSLRAGKPADCGAAGTTLRFLALRASRIPGEHRLVGSERLLARPQTEIQNLLNQLGCEVKIGKTEMIIRGEGWKIPAKGLVIDRSVSSQFASAVVLSAWDLPKPLLIHFAGHSVSTGYLQMTLDLARDAGLRFSPRGADELVIDANCDVNADSLSAEPDLSSAFAVAAVAMAGNGSVSFDRWPTQSLQPDARFPFLLRQMGCRLQIGNPLRIEAPANGVLQALDVNLENEPDLFPVLSVLCAFAQGTSHLVGAPHLAHKESSRIEKSAELLRLLGAEPEARADGMTIHGGLRTHVRPLVFDPEHDHRMAFAAQVAVAAGFRIEILHPDVVNKSFPEFWNETREAQR